MSKFLDLVYSAGMVSSRRHFSVWLLALVFSANSALAAAVATVNHHCCPQQNPSATVESMPQHPSHMNSSRSTPAGHTNYNIDAHRAGYADAHSHAHTTAEPVTPRAQPKSSSSITKTLSQQGALEAHDDSHPQQHSCHCELGQCAPSQCADARTVSSPALPVASWQDTAHLGAALNLLAPPHGLNSRVQDPPLKPPRS